ASSVSYPPVLHDALPIWHPAGQVVGGLAHIAGVDADRGGVVLQRLVAQSPDLGPGGLGFEQGVVHPGEDLLLGVAAHWNSAPFLQRLHSRAWCSQTPEKITARAPQVPATMPR